MFIYG